MRIISSFHDYYDTAQGYGQDPNLIYQRSVDMREYPAWQVEKVILEILKLEPNYYDFKARLALLGFCGKCFPLWFDAKFDFDLTQFSMKQQAKVSLDEDAVLKLHDHLSRHKYGWNINSVRSVIRKVKAIDGREIQSENFRLFDCPIFLLFVPQRTWRTPERVSVIRNPCLANLGFQKHFDAFAAFQEIAMFLGSALATEDTAPRTVGGDAVIAASKGFDDQSFRTATPGVKKLNRTRNRLRKRGQSES